MHDGRHKSSAMPGGAKPPSGCQVLDEPEILRVDPAIRALLPPLSAGQREQLRRGLREHGCHQPLLVFQGTLIDGFETFEACKLEGIVPPVKELDFPDRDAALAYRVRIHATRRNLTPLQIACLVMPEFRRRVAESNSRKSRIAGKSGGRGRPRHAQPGGPKERGDAEAGADIRKEMSLEFDISVDALKVALRAFKQYPELFERAKADNRLTPKLVRQKLDEHRRTELRRRAIEADADPGNDIEIITGDFALLHDRLPDSSVDMVVLDLPWAVDQVHLYDAVGRLAAAKLKPGGFLVAHFGVLTEISATIELVKHLEDYCLADIDLGGQHARIHDRNLRVNSRPGRIFVKSPRRSPPVHGDVETLIKGAGREKEYHEWQQNATDVAYYIARLTLPGDLVVDPTVGSGSSAVAAKALARRFVGVDIDAEAAAIARQRCSEIEWGSWLKRPSAGGQTDD